MIGVLRMFLYDGLISRLKEKGITKTQLSEQLGISSRTIAKIGKGITCSAMWARFSVRCPTTAFYRSFVMKNMRGYPADYIMNYRFV